MFESSDIDFPRAAQRHPIPKEDSMSYLSNDFLSDAERNRAATLDRIEKTSSMSFVERTGVRLAYGTPVLGVIASIGVGSPLRPGVSVGLAGAAVLTGLAAGDAGVKSWNLSYELDGIKSSFAIPRGSLAEIERKCESAVSPNYVDVFAGAGAGAYSGYRFGGLAGAVVGAVAGTVVGYFSSDTTHKVAQRKCEVKELKSLVMNDLTIKER